jgi:hypothetical protein
VITYRAHKRKDGCRTVFAYDGKQKVGHIGACPSLHYLEVAAINVLGSHQRQKIGTGLYTKLAEIACADGRPLASARFQRNNLSDSFWQKQVRLGRAAPVENKPGLVAIKCPVPSLAGRRHH